MFAVSLVQRTGHATPGPRKPQIDSPSPPWTRGPDIVPPKYYPEQHEVWRKLHQLQSELAPRYVCSEYLQARERFYIDELRIPDLRELDSQLKRLCGWGLIRAPGYVEHAQFFQFLDEKLFPCSDELRHVSEITYSPEPDMWHDIAGHVPMLTDPVFGEFYEVFGRVGRHIRNDYHLKVLNKVYLFSMEFGIINPTATSSRVGDIASARLYGAALVAVTQEMADSLSPAVQRLPFSIEAVAGAPLDVDRAPSVLFEVPNLESLLAQLVDWARSEQLI